MMGNKIEVTLPKYGNFLKIVETLSRIGKKVPDKNIIIQTCYILHKRGKYYILHYKELKEIDGLHVDITEYDYGIRNTISDLLDEWGLLKVVDMDLIDTPKSSLKNIKIVKFSDKNEWEFKCSYNIGKKY